MNNIPIAVITSIDELAKAYWNKEGKEGTPEKMFEKLYYKLPWGADLKGIKFPNKTFLEYKAELRILKAPIPKTLVLNNIYIQGRILQDDFMKDHKIGYGKEDDTPLKEVATHLLEKYTELKNMAGTPQ